MNAAALERVLSESGIPCHVETHEGLAVVVLAPGHGLEVLEVVRERREWITAQARAHGFTHVALEIGESASSAPFPRP